MTCPLPRRHRGTTIVEFMIAITIGFLVLAALAQTFADSSQTHREAQRTAEQIENGRYAADVITHDLHHAGFYGQYFRLPAAGAAMPDPCAVSDAAAAITSGLPFAVQGYDATSFTGRPDVSATSCAALTTANLAPGSDVLVIRRAGTAVIAVGTATIANDAYLQANAVEAAIQFGAGAVIGATQDAAGALSTIKGRDGTTSAEIRKFHVHVYFVAPCSRPAGGGDVCTGATDDNGRPIPTLKRLELTSVGGATTMRVMPIAEGVEYMQIDYGLDDSPSVVNAFTGLKGDGSPDRYVRTPGVAEMPDIVTARLHLIARGSDPSAVAAPAKTFDLGLAGTVGPFGDRFRRHAYVNVVRVINPSSRREIPQ
jgi:type IV pilus assembly protein PilW